MTFKCYHHTIMFTARLNDTKTRLFSNENTVINMYSLISLFVNKLFLLDDMKMLLKLKYIKKF